MSTTPFMQLYINDYVGKTRHLTTEQHGAYLLILMAMWRAGGSLPNDEKKLARIAGLTPARWRRISDDVMDFMTVYGDKITQKRLMKEIKKVNEIASKRRSAGSKGGKAKALKTKETALANGIDLLPDLPQHSHKQKHIEEPLPPAGAPPLKAVPTVVELTEIPDYLRREQPAKPNSKPPPKRGTRLPDDWTLTDDWRQAAADARNRHSLPAIDLDLAAEKFANHWQDKGGQLGTKITWRKTWINWALSENQRGKPHGGSPAGREDGFATILRETAGRSAG